MYNNNSQQQASPYKRRFEEFYTNVLKRSYEIANESDSTTTIVVGKERGEENTRGGQCPIRRKRFRRAKDIVKSAVADSISGLTSEEMAFMNTPEYFEMMRQIEEEISRELNSGRETEEDLLKAYEDSLCQECYDQTQVMCPLCRAACLVENPGVWIQCLKCGFYLTINDPTLNAEYLGRMIRMSYENHTNVKKCPVEPVIKMSPDGRCLIFSCGLCNEYTVLI